MIYWHIILAGIAGTLLMTAYLYLLTFITGRNFKVVRTLSLILSNKSSYSKHGTLQPTTLLRGILAHYAIGVMFALVYYWLWEHGIGKPELLNGLLFGALNGMFAIVCWYLFIVFYNQPLGIPMPGYLLAVGSGHLFFGIGTVFIFNLLNYLSIFA